MERMDCEICMEALNLTDRLPKTLPCIHTVCLACVKCLRTKECPQCRKAFTAAPAALPDNYYIVNLLRAKTDSLHQGAGQQQWCVPCGAVASAGCLAGSSSSISSSGGGRRHEVLDCSEALRRRLRQLRDDAHLVSQQLLDSRSLLSDETRILVVLELLSGQTPVSCSLTLRRDGKACSTAEWQTGGTPLQQQQQTQDALLAMLIAALANKNLLQQQQQQQQQQRRQGNQDGRSQSALSPQQQPRAGRPLNDTGAPAAQQQAAAPAAAPAAALAAAPAASPPQNPDSRIAQLDLAEISQSSYAKKRVPKDLLVGVASQHGIRRMTNLTCEEDSNWSLQLLESVAPHVEELQAFRLCSKHIPVLCRMPQLRRLHITASHHLRVRRTIYTLVDHLDRIERQHRGLEWLCMEGMPRAQTAAFLRAHGARLATLLLFVGTKKPAGYVDPDDEDRSEEWPFQCNDLQVFFQECGVAKLRALRRLVLMRDPDYWHQRPHCIGQITAVRAVLGDRVQVSCSYCHPCPAEVISF